MKVFIPEHLRNLKIVEQLRQMLIEYSTGVDENGESYIVDSIDSFSNYKYMLKLDPVKKFLSMCIKEDSPLVGDNDYLSIINYFSHLFYSVKGTKKVIDYMEQYLKGDKLNFSVNYSTKSLQIDIETLEVEDPDNFTDSLKGFIEALLYCVVDSISAEKIRLIIDDKILTKMGYTVIPFEENIIEEL